MNNHFHHPANSTFHRLTRVYTELPAKTLETLKQLSKTQVYQPLERNHLKSPLYPAEASSLSEFKPLRKLHTCIETNSNKSSKPQHMTSENGIISDHCDSTSLPGLTNCYGGGRRAEKVKSPLLKASPSWVSVIHARLLCSQDQIWDSCCFLIHQAGIQQQHVNPGGLLLLLSQLLKSGISITKLHPMSHSVVFSIPLHISYPLYSYNGISLLPFTTLCLLEFLSRQQLWTVAVI